MHDYYSLSSLIQCVSFRTQVRNFFVSFVAKYSIFDYKNHDQIEA